MQFFGLMRSAIKGRLVAAMTAWVMACVPSGAAPAGYGWNIGTAGWSLEQFGPNVTILRSLSQAEASHEATLLLSCSFGNLRLRITLPSALPGRLGEPGPGGTSLVREHAAEFVPGPATLGTFQTPNARQLEFQDTVKGSGFIKAIVRILQMRRGEIEMLVSFGNPPRPMLGRLVAYVFVPVLGPGDDAMLAHVASACGLRDKPMRQ